MTHSIYIIGGGNMGGAIARALHATPEFSVTLIEPEDVKRREFAVLGIPTFATLAEGENAAHAILLAVKPQQFPSILEELKTARQLETAPLLISIMAGIPIAALQQITPNVVRAMPNLPAIIHESMSVLCAPTLDAPAKALAESIFAAIGKTAWVKEEEQLHAVTAISGSGPAYLFAFMEALATTAEQHGLEAEQAKIMIAQTMLGASLLASESPDSFANLRAQVTSKGGTTEAALATLKKAKFQDVIAEAVDAAIERSKVLAKA